jgi:hypothetical protein
MGLREHICFYFATKGSKRCFYWGVPKVPKKFGDGINVAPSKQNKKIRKKKEKCDCTHELIHMDCTI